MQLLALSGVSLLLVPFAWTIPTTPVDPVDVPLPPQIGRSSPPPPGHKGIHVDDISDTHMTYGSDPVHGIRNHAFHVKYNYDKFPENNQPFPRNRGTPKEKTNLRTTLIGNKPITPGMSRDHKPPNLQDMPDLTIEQRKARTTTQGLPTRESNAEMQLAKQAVLKSQQPGLSNHIQLDHGIRPGSALSNPASSLHSVPGGASRIPRPVQRSQPALDPSSPRHTRSGRQYSGQRAQTQAQTPSTPPRVSDDPRTPVSRIPRPVQRHDTPPSRIPRPIWSQNLAFRPATPDTPTPAPRKRDLGRYQDLVLRKIRRALILRRALMTL